MAGFDAGREVEPLDFDFTSVKVSDPEAQAVLADAKGTIPEPTQDALDAYLQKMKRMAATPSIAKIIALGDDPPAAAVLAAMEDVSEEDMGNMNNAMLEGVVDLCAGCPSEEQIRALPPRVRTAFVGWLSRKLVDPTVPTAVSTPSPAVANGVGPTT